MDEDKIQNQISYILRFNRFFNIQEASNNVVRKSLSASVITRKQGNDIYTSKVPPHDKEIHEKILSLYTQSIALAPMGSEELALGYSNRSALLFHFRKYDKCIIDIDRALQLISCNKLMEKLQLRKEKCLNLMRSEVSYLDEENDVKLPVIKASKMFPCAAESVSLQYNKKYGRHLIANNNIKPGEIIIIEEGCACPDYNKIYLTCSHCMAYAWNGIPCDHCVYAVYCSEKCKTEAWQEYHDVECAILPYIYTVQSMEDFQIISAMVLGCRVFITFVKKEGLQSILDSVKAIDNGKDLHVEGFLPNGVFDNKKFQTYYNLLKNSEIDKRVEEDEDDLLFESVTVNLLYRCSNILDTEVHNNAEEMSSDSRFVIAKDIMRIIKRMLETYCSSYQGTTCNCTSVSACLSECKSIRGSIISPFSKLINHSCVPNVSRMFLPGKKVVTFTTSPIKKGDQLFDTYGPTLFTNKKEREFLLQDRFNINCYCKACTYNWPSASPILTGTILNRLKLERNLNKFSKLMMAKASFQNHLETITYNEEMFKNSIKMIERIHENYKDFEAYSYSLAFKDYIDKALFKLYGEKCNIPNDCK